MGLGVALLLAMLALTVGGFFSPGQTQARHIGDVPIRPDEVILMPNRVITPHGLPSTGFRMKHYDIDVAVKDNIATTTVSQEFLNESNRTIEAKYLFPLPEDADFSSFNLTIDGETLEGQLMEREAARQKYYEIVRKLVDPGLLEFIDCKTVQVSVAPIPAGQSRTIKLSYSQLLTQDGGLYRYQYPFVGKASRNVPIDKAGIDVSLRTAQPLKTVYSPTHSPKITRDGQKRADVSLDLNEQQSILEKNFVLYFSQDNSEVSVNTLSYKGNGENGYFLMTIRPPKDILDQKVLPKNVVLVLDTSGSMSGDKIVQARNALKYIVQQLRPEDTFNIVQFNTDVSTWRNESLAATSKNKNDAIDYVEDLNAGGSTNIEEALKVSFSQVPTSKGDRPSYVIFLTDGEPTIGVTDTPGLLKVAKAANTKNAKLFNFGVGYSINTNLLAKLAADHHGSTTFVEPNENLELAMTGFYTKIDAPVLANAKVDFGRFRVSKIYPNEIGDLFAGSEVILMGRYDNGGADTVKLTGNVGGQTKTYTFPVSWENDSTRHNQLPRLWAGRRIGYLLDNIHQHGENEETKKEIVDLSKKFGIMTPYTSFLALEKKEGRVMADAPMEMDQLRRQDVHGRSMPAASPAMSSIGSYRADSGAGAVRLKKSLQNMQSQASMAKMDEEQEIASGEAVLGIRKVGGKIFSISKDGVWIDTDYDAAKHGEPQKVTFGTDAYFDLLTKNPALAQYFAIGQKVRVVINGKAYEVTAASDSTS